ncbi:MAG: translation initiation factor IF-2 [Bacteroidetes bacterium]|nr:MAG: translation initiation factor IF-2 [Bacteroidota bacterium]
MTDTKLPRLLQAAREFNVGQDTLVEFLAAKGFQRDELKPTAKLSEAMYESLQREFQGDKVAKAKSDLIDLPKGHSSEPRRRREDEEISFLKKEDKKHGDKEIIGEIKSEEKPLPPEPIVAVAPPVAPPPAPAAVAPEPAQLVAPAPAAEPVAVAPQEQVQVAATPAAPAPADTPAAPVSNLVKIEAPELEGPKIITKIDLSTIDSSSRPKKGAPKKEEPKPAPAAVAPTPAPAPVVPPAPAAPVPVETAPVASAPTQETAEVASGPVIENIQAERLTGPKILGRIELPVDNDTRPRAGGNSAADREKRKRKRIPLPADKRAPGAATGQQAGPGGYNRPAGGQQGNRPPMQGGGQNRPGQNRPGQPAAGRQDRTIDEKEIQRKLQETQARLSGGNRPGKGMKARLRRDKRREMAEANEGVDHDTKLRVTEFISVSELANLMDVSFAEVIGKCMSLGMMVSINQRLDAEVIELVSSEFGFDVEFIDMEKQAELEDEEDEDDPEELSARAPIVTIMGHVDHGKTSLLDYVRKANVVSGEAGGITQHIGAYEVTTTSGKKVTFLDTPGHEAFTAMRARGAKVTDIAVIVVAADDAVMPQTREAISHAQAANVPMIFAVNKIDKDGANPQKIYEQLSQMNILVEEWGGKFQNQEISAKQGLNIDVLLEKIALEAELLDLKANPGRNANGTIIEATLDKGRGYVATVLVQNGTLSNGDVVVSGQYFGRVKAMFDERNQKKTEAGPSVPVLILGLNGAPQAGEKFKVYQDEAEAKEVAYKRGQILREQGMRTKKHITLDEIGRRLALGNFKELNVIIKGDVDGSVEALSDSLQKLSTEEIVVKVILKGVGAISENDVTLASASDAIIMGFNVRPNQQAAKLAEQEGIEIKQYSIIYNAIADIKAAMEGLLEPKIEEKEVAQVEIREVYKFDKATVAGCYVLSGKLKRDAKIRIYRDNALLYPRTEGGFAELGSLKRYKDDMKEVASNFECGLTVKNYVDIQVGDMIVAIEEEEVKRTL